MFSVYSRLLDKVAVERKRKEKTYLETQCIRRQELVDAAKIADDQMDGRKTKRASRVEREDCVFRAIGAGCNTLSLLHEKTGIREDYVRKIAQWLKAAEKVSFDSENGWRVI